MGLSCSPRTPMSRASLHLGTPCISRRSPDDLPITLINGGLAIVSPTIHSNNNIDIQHNNINFTPLAIVAAIKGFSEIRVGEIVFKSPFETC